MSKAIQVIPHADTSEKIDRLIERRVARSRAAFCETVVEGLLPLIEQGVAGIFNGRVVFLKMPPVDSMLAAALGSEPALSQDLVLGS